MLWTTTRPPQRRRHRRRQRQHLRLTTTIEATTTTVTTVPPENPEQFGPPTLSSRSTVSTVGLDTVNFGMTVAEAQRAAGTVLVPAGPTGPCYHVRPPRRPRGHRLPRPRGHDRAGRHQQRAHHHPVRRGRRIAREHGHGPVRRLGREAGANRRDRRPGLRSPGSGVTGTTGSSSTCLRRSGAGPQVGAPPPSDARHRLRERVARRAPLVTTTQPGSSLVYS